MNYLQNPQAKLKQYLLNRIKEVNFPIPILDSSLPWVQFSGIFIGTAVVIENNEDATILLNERIFSEDFLPKSSVLFFFSFREEVKKSKIGYKNFGVNTQGSFGKRAWLPFVFEKHSIIRKRQWNRRKEWQSKWQKYDKIDPLHVNEIMACKSTSDQRQDSQEDSSLTENCSDKIKPISKKTSPYDCSTVLPERAKYTLNDKATEVIVINDSGDECVDGKTFVSKLRPTICEESMKTVQETFFLSLEEAFFLSFALYCLTVTPMHTTELLNIDELWTLYINADPNFVEKYVTYHYFRSKGWIVKSGLNFGCDFALYKRGPAYYHASCLVKIRNINHPTKPSLSWEKIMGYCRVSEAAKKDFVLFEVTWPKNTTANTCGVKDLGNFCVSHKFLQRWTASEHRDTYQARKKGR